MPMRFAASASSKRCVVRRTPCRPPRAPEERREVAAGARVEAGRGLVEEEDGRLVKERLRDLDAAREPARERLDEVVRAVPDRKRPEERVDAGPERGAGHAEQRALQREVLPHGELLVEARGLEDDAQPAAHGADVAAGSRPSTRNVPDVARSSVARMRKSVVLPPPFGPRRAKISPRATESVARSSARRAP
jgi:hypothetical protein